MLEGLIDNLYNCFYKLFASSSNAQQETQNHSSGKQSEPPIKNRNTATDIRIDLPLTDLLAKERQITVNGIPSDDLFFERAINRYKRYHSKQDAFDHSKDKSVDDFNDHKFALNRIRSAFPEPVASPVKQTSTSSRKSYQQSQYANSKESLEYLLDKLQKTTQDFRYYTKFQYERKLIDEEVHKQRETIKAPTESKRLTEADLLRVQTFLQSHNDSYVFRRKKMELSMHDLKTLRDTCWLNDQIINSFALLINERSRERKEFPKAHSFNTFFFEKLKKRDFKTLARWVRKASVNLSSLDLIFVPINISMSHWTLLTVNVKHKRIEYWDSMKGKAKFVFQLMKDFYSEQTAIDTNEWGDYYPPNQPLQTNGYDCGVFVCKTIESMSRNYSIDFESDEMPEIRKKIFLSLLDGEIYV